MFDRNKAHVYVWQMNDGRWHISPRFYNQQQERDTAVELWRGGLDRGFETRQEAETALAQWRAGVDRKITEIDDGMGGRYRPGVIIA